jgi:Flp pilus assembly protein TadD
MMRRLLAIIAAGLLILLGFWAFRAWKVPDPVPSKDADPRLVFSTPFRNVRPDVGYVGDSECARCHAEQARKYRLHPMGRSVSPVEVDDKLEHYDAKANNPFELDGFRFRAERTGNQLLHHETRLAKSEADAVNFNTEVHFALGSGTRARSYLINRDNRLYQSALTWYSQREVWDLSPGFSGNPHSDRPVTAECLFCHVNQIKPVANAVNQFQPPLATLEPIGCERCHGPGQLHVSLCENNLQEIVGGESIVNPRHLDPQLRDAICEQCHLQGAVRVLRRGREVFDYRPGLPLGLFWSVYVNPSSPAHQNAAVSQVEQMVASRCFQGSEGKLGCTSCHDPHEAPLPENKVGFYRRRCLECHETKPCTLAQELRLKKADDCTTCHMPRSLTSDVAHTAISNHFILRRPIQVTSALPKDKNAQLSSTDLVLYGVANRLEENEDAQRDLAIAQVRLAETRQLNKDQRIHLSQRALTALEEAVQRRPDDIPATEAKAYALWALNRKAEALSSFNAVLTRFPERESALMEAALLSSQLGQRDAAIKTWRRAIDVNPYSTRAHYELAKLLLVLQDSPAALKEAEATLELNPFHFEARKLLITCCLETKDKARARKEFAILMNINPPDPIGLRKSFQDQLR